eukprot:m.21976 g.21976  ORF g.21976 m.21976 type:complete len:941 (-) comp13634_c0_seq1:213-3035(-)
MMGSRTLILGFALIGALVASSNGEEIQKAKAQAERLAYEAAVKLLELERLKREETNPTISTIDGVLAVKAPKVVFTLDEGILNLAEMNMSIGKAVDNITSMVESNIADVVKTIEENKEDTDEKVNLLDTTITGVTDALGVRITTLDGETKASFTKIQGGFDNSELAKAACVKAGLLWDGSVCIKPTPVLGYVTTCTDNEEGTIRYNDVPKTLEYCNGATWNPAAQELGMKATTPASSCGDLAKVAGTGMYFVNMSGTVTRTACLSTPTEEWMVPADIGTFADGDIVISQSIAIEKIFQKYDPRRGVYPNWKKVTITNNAVLTTAAYNPTTDVGGIIAFKAAVLIITKGSRIDVSAAGHPGGASAGLALPSTNARSKSGGGDGGGVGGCGGNCNGISAHGAGGGGGSFRTKGTMGTPDRMRQLQYSEFSAVAGSVYKTDSLYWEASPKMGSGGGAGGQGHPGSKPGAAPGAGGRGGGVIQIAAGTINNLGEMRANGQGGGAQNPANSDNPQTGSGGGGSGGLIKLMMQAGLSGKSSVKGGAKGPNQKWNKRKPPPRPSGVDHYRVEYGQTGGEGGDGYVINTALPDMSECGGRCRLGSEQLPASSCAQLKAAGYSSGNYYIGTGGRSALWKCALDGYPSGVTWGDGLDGDLTIQANKAVYIEDLFPSYAPRLNIFPQWNKVVINSGGALLVRDFDGHSGGLISFAAKSLLIRNNGRISANNAGYRGGADFWNTGTSTGALQRGASGEGPGGGTGGKGNKGCCHGSGGGGGSFGSFGQTGNPDLNRDSNERESIPGAPYEFRGEFFVADEVMGSGGGAGGPGHPGNSECEAFPGSPGGGTIQIMAKYFQNDGSIQANGARGGPTSGYCQWPNGNPQSGSGGGGSGGGIKIFTAQSVGTAYNTNQLYVGGGDRPIVQGWGYRDNQQGGSGGAGRKISRVVDDF